MNFALSYQLKDNEGKGLEELEEGDVTLLQQNISDTYLTHSFLFKEENQPKRLICQITFTDTSQRNAYT